MLKRSFDLENAKVSGQNFFRGHPQVNDKSVFKIKNTRKIIEADAQMLSNRIALLRQEELKAWKRIEEAKKKATEVYSTKIKIEERQKMKADKIKDNHMFIRDSQLAYANLRKQDQMKLENIKTAIYQQRHNEFLQIRKQRDINDAKVRDFKDKVVETKRDRSLKVKEQEVTSKMRYNQYHANRAKEYKRTYEQEASFQDSLKNQRQIELSSLENLEQEILSRLRQTERVEQKVTSQLEEALALSPTEFSSKYNGELPSPKKRIYSVGKRRPTPSRTQLLQDIQLSLKSNLDESFRLSLSPAKSTRNDKYLQDDWLNKDERISREIKVYGRQETPRNNKGSILEKFVMPRVQNMNRSMYVHDRNNIPSGGTDAGGGKTTGRRHEKFSPMSRNKSLGTEVSAGSDRVETEHDQKQGESKEKTLSIEVRSKPGSRNNVDKLRSSSNQKPRKSNLIGSRYNMEKGRSRAGSHVNSQGGDSKGNVEKEPQNQQNGERVDVISQQQTIEKEQDEVVLKEDSVQVKSQIEGSGSVIETEKNNNEEETVQEAKEVIEAQKEEAQIEPEKVEPEVIESEASKKLGTVHEEKEEETARQVAPEEQQQIAEISS